jgi:hypothetical protein
MTWRIGRHASNVSLDPPTMMPSFPSNATLGAPVTGASNMETPLARARSAMERETAGVMLLMSIRTRPGCAPSRTPLGPQDTCSDAAESVTMVMTTSEVWARALGEAAVAAPAAQRCLAFSAVRFHTVRG